MHRMIAPSLVALGLLAFASGRQAAFLPAYAADTAVPPVARVVPKEFLEFGQKRIDNYDWLRDRDDPAVADLLRAENAYVDARLKPLKPLVNELAAELKARSVEADVSVPYSDNGYLYERRFTRGAPYPVIVRRKDTAEAPEEIVLDVGALAAGHPQYRLGYWTVSPDNTRVAFAVDFTGNREFRVFVRTIATGKVVDQGIVDVAANLVFAADSETLFYVRNEAKTVRSYQVWRHRLGADAAGDALVYEEKDPTFSISLELSKSRQFIFMEIDEERTSEVRYLPADRPTDEFKIMQPRTSDVLYHADHVGDRFFIRTNLDAPDYRIVTAPQATPDAAHWTELIAQQPGQHLSHFETFDNFIAIDVDRDGNSVIRAFRLSDMHEIDVPRSSEIGVASTFFFGGTGGNRVPSSNVLRFRFTAPLQPQSIYDFNMASGALTLRKQDPATKWFKPEPYGLARIFATAPDGERVPVTLVYRKDMRRSGGNPALVVGYGSYGISFRPTFTGSTFSLIDRGFVYAIAHVRGGHEMGERWYDEGRVLNKRNTFTDFIAATQALIAQGYADPKAIFAQGRSAGGLLMGAVANMRPDLYAGIVAEVPFVDVITTMSDASVPLTTLEYQEWGNPAIKPQYDYMLSYSPYDNVKRQNYPALFITAGFHDSQVSYAEPAKWVARLRALKTGDHEILFKTNMGAGHGGRSGRLGSLTEDAEIMAWLLAHAAAVSQP
jgi:oligopeptidase B